MKRLTFERNFCDISMCRENPCPYDGACSPKETWERLKDIEDILGEEYDLERLREMVEAEKDGRLVVLPCRVGDIVYYIHQDKTILPGVVKWFETNDGWTVCAQYTPMAPKFFRFADFGKTVFLTREAAEAALAACKKGGKDHA